MAVYIVQSGCLGHSVREKGRVLKSRGGGDEMGLID